MKLLRTEYYEYSQYENVLLICSNRTTIEKYVKAWGLLGSIQKKETNIFKYWFYKQCIPVLYKGKNDKFLVR